MSLKWAINGILDDIYFMAQGLPRVLFTWKPENQLSILNFFENNVKKYPTRLLLSLKINLQLGKKLTKKFLGMELTCKRKVLKKETVLHC